MTSPRFSPDQSAELMRFTRRQVEAAIRRRADNPPLADELAAIPVAGLFVTLRRGGKLRACIGNWRGSDTGPLGEALTHAACSAPVDDHRFPPIGEDELADLEIEVSLLFDPRPVEAAGEERVSAVEIGRHGLILEGQRHRGLLLPQVATERGWDARTFLDHTAIKAGLPANAWRDPAVKIITFQALQLHDKR